MQDAIHSGHRERMRERISRNGISSLQSHELLEYLLYPFIPRKDTNKIAHDLINKFGSLSQVLNTDAEHLASVPGMTANAALFLSSLPDIFREYLVDSDAPKISLKGKGAARQYLGNLLYGATTEKVFVIGLDIHDKLIRCEELSSGDAKTVGLTARGVVDFALRCKAASVLIAHNHPGGNVNPSADDIDLTYQIYLALTSVGVTLQDHFIFSGGTYYSFADMGKFATMTKVSDTLKEGISFYG